MSRRTLAYLFLIIGLIGFLDASYLAIKHYRGEVPPCSFVAGCEAVTTSRYSLIANVPVALLGALYYLTVLVLTIGYLDTRKPILLTLASALTPLGFLASLWFVYLQAAVIRAWCLYCLVSAGTSAALFGLGMGQLALPPERWWQRLAARLRSLIKR